MKLLRTEREHLTSPSITHLLKTPLNQIYDEIHLPKRRQVFKRVGAGPLLLGGVGAGEPEGYHATFIYDYIYYTYS
jgi:hypothetical protein